MTYVPLRGRYDSMPYRRVGRTGLKLPAVAERTGTNEPFDPAFLDISAVNRALVGGC